MLTNTNVSRGHQAAYYLLMKLDAEKIKQATIYDIKRSGGTDGKR